jgi:transportin-1
LNKQLASSSLSVFKQECGQHLKDSTVLLFPLLIQNLDMVLPSVCYNASWAIGELVMHVDPAQLQPFVEPIMQRLISLVNDKSENHHSLVR